MQFLFFEHFFFLFTVLKCCEATIQFIFKFILIYSQSIEYFDLYCSNEGKRNNTQSWHVICILFYILFTWLCCNHFNCPISDEINCDEFVVFQRKKKNLFWSIPFVIFSSIRAYFLQIFLHCCLLLLFSGKFLK